MNPLATLSESALLEAYLATMVRRDELLTPLFYQLEEAAGAESGELELRYERLKDGFSVLLSGLMAEARRRGFRLSR